MKFRLIVLFCFFSSIQVFCSSDLPKEAHEYKNKGNKARKEQIERVMLGFARKAGGINALFCGPEQEEEEEARLIETFGKEKTEEMTSRFIELLNVLIGPIDASEAE